MSISILEALDIPTPAAWHGWPIPGQKRLRTSGSPCQQLWHGPTQPAKGIISAYCIAEVWIIQCAKATSLSVLSHPEKARDSRRGAFAQGSVHSSGLLLIFQGHVWPFLAALAVPEGLTFGHSSSGRAISLQVVAGLSSPPTLLVKWREGRSHFRPWKIPGSSVFYIRMQSLFESGVKWKETKTSQSLYLHY